MRPTFHLVTLLSLLCSIACSSGRTPGGARDGGASDASGSDAGFSPNCPASPVQDFFTCISSTNGAVCPGTIYCDSCAMNVATSCTCMPYEAGFQFRCTDPCESCSMNTDAGVDAGADGGFVDSESWASCYVNSGGTMLCLQFSPTGGTDGPGACETVGGDYRVGCPEGRTGGCGYAEGGDRLWVYSSDSASTLMASCLEEGNTWLGSP